MARQSPEGAQAIADAVEKKLGAKSPVTKFKVGPSCKCQQLLATRQPLPIRTVACTVCCFAGAAHHQAPVLEGLLHLPALHAAPFILRQVGHSSRHWAVRQQEQEQHRSLIHLPCWAHANGWRCPPLRAALHHSNAHPMPPSHLLSCPGRMQACTPPSACTHALTQRGSIRLHSWCCPPPPSLCLQGADPLQGRP